MRRKTTVPGWLASASLVTNSRPVRVAAHSVPVSLGARAMATTYWPLRDEPNELVVRLPPICAQSPQGSMRLGSNSAIEQPFSSRKCLLPPWSSVRQTCSSPVKSATRHLRVGDERGVEGAFLFADLQRVVDVEPAVGVVAFEVHFRRRVVVVVVADRCVARSKPDWPPSPPTFSSHCSAGSAEASYPQVPLSWVPPSSESVGCCGVEGERLELEVVEAVVERFDRRRDPVQQHLAVGEVERLQRGRGPRGRIRICAVRRRPTGPAGCRLLSAPRLRRSRRRRRCRFRRRRSRAGRGGCPLRRPMLCWGLSAPRSCPARRRGWRRLGRLLRRRWWSGSPRGRWSAAVRPP